MGKVKREITFDPVQEAIFNEFARDKNLSGKFYFTGGTALSAVYLHHRVSEDLDFFSEKEFDNQPILLRKYTVWDLLHFVKVKFNMEIDTVWLASGCLKTGSFENMPKMLVPLDLSELKSFYKDLALQLGKSVVKK